MLEVKNLIKHFPLNGGRKIRAVNGVSFSVKENEILGIVGESGCGKSTLGRLVLRLLEPGGGQVFFKGEEITKMRGSALRGKRRAMQMIFQNPFASFNPKIRIEGALAEVSRYYGMSAEESREKRSGLFADMGLTEDILYMWPRDLSGGQLQRLAIVRALLSEPSLIVAGEPLSALDVSVQAQLLNLLESLRKTRSMVMLFISHDMTVVEYFCDRVAVMYLGIIMELVSAAELSAAEFSATNALHPYTRSLRASSPRLDLFRDSPQTEKAPLIIKGEAPNPTDEIRGCPFAPRCPDALPRCMTELPELREVSSGTNHWVRCHLFS